MKRKTSKILGLFLAVLMVVSLLPMTVLAAEAPDVPVTEYDLWVGETRVTSDNLSGTGWSFTPDSSTLTLNNYSYSGAGIYSMNNGDTYEYGAIFSKLASLTIELVGNNSVTHTGGTYTSQAVFSTGDLLFTGSGSLTATAGVSTDGWAGHSIGITSYTAVTLDSAFTGIITSNAGDSCNYNGYIASVGLGGGNKLTVKSGTLVANGGTVTDTGYGRSYGIYANGYEQTGGTVISSGGTVPDSFNNLSYGMYAGNNGSITGGSFTFVGDDYAVRNVLTLGPGVEALASANRSGEGATAYSAGNISSYRYISNGAVVPTPPLGIAFTVTPPKAGESTAIIGSGVELSSDSSDYIIIGDQYAASVSALDSFNYFEGTFSKTDYYSYALIVPTGSPITAISESDVSISGASFVSAEVNEYGEAKVYFKVTIDEDAEVIDTLNIEVTLPEGGQEYFDPDPTTEDVNYTISSAAWLDSDDEIPDEFISGEDYSLDLLLKPARGYVFAESVSVSLNGADPVEVDVAETLSFNEVLIPIMPKGTTLTLDIRCSNGATGTLEYMRATDKTSTTLSITENTEIALPVPAGVTTLSIKATPAEGYYINQGQTNDGTGTYTDKAALAAALLDHADFTVTTDATITIEFDNHDGVPAPPPSGGGSEAAIYPIAAPVAENGTVTVSPAAASIGTTVTVTPKPDEGYEVGKVTVTDKDGNEIPVTDNGDGTYSFTMPGGKVTVNVAFKEIDHSAVCPSKAFKDVDPDVWYHEAVDYVVGKGLMLGIADDHFDPDGTTTRAMIVTILYRLEGKPTASGTSPFDDVAADQWYTDAVIWASENDIVSGYGGGKFGPMDDITREQFATILFRYAQYKGYDVSAGEDTNVLSCNDAFAVSDWAMPAIQWACGAGLMQGDGLGNLLPGNRATRAQAAAFIMRFIENVSELR